MDLNPIEEIKDTGKEKWKQKSVETMLGFPKSKMKGGKKKQSDLLRSTVAIAALPLSSIGINRTHIDKAQAVWAVNKIMGLHYSGDGKDLTRQFAIMEAEDEERTKAHGIHHND